MGRHSFSELSSPALIGVEKSGFKFAKIHMSWSGGNDKSVLQDLEWDPIGIIFVILMRVLFFLQLLQWVSSEHWVLTDFNWFLFCLFEQSNLLLRHTRGLLLESHQLLIPDKIHLKFLVVNVNQIHYHLKCLQSVVLQSHCFCFFPTFFSFTFFCWL